MLYLSVGRRNSLDSWHSIKPDVRLCLQNKNKSAVLCIISSAKHKSTKDKERALTMVHIKSVFDTFNTFFSLKWWESHNFVPIVHDPIIVHALLLLVQVQKSKGRLSGEKPTRKVVGYSAIALLHDESYWLPGYADRFQVEHQHISTALCASQFLSPCALHLVLLSEWLDQCSVGNTNFWTNRSGKLIVHGFKWMTLVHGFSSQCTIVYVVVVVPSYRAQYRRLLNFGGDYIYANSRTTTKNHEISDQMAIGLLSGAIRTNFLVLFSLALASCSPIFTIAFTDKKELAIPILMPFIDETTQNGFYINLANQIVICVVGGFTIAAIELATSILKNNFTVTAAVIANALEEFEDMLAGDLKISIQQSWHFRNIIVKINDFYRWRNERFVCERN